MWDPDGRERTVVDPAPNPALREKKEAEMREEMSSASNSRSSHPSLSSLPSTLHQFPIGHYLNDRRSHAHDCAGHGIVEFVDSRHPYTVSAAVLCILREIRID